jgi:trans-2,3-dihydro-3-hydroxyanthranilate isomerase
MQYLFYDVFTGQPLLGNQLAVFTDGRGLTTAQMQAIAREINFSETTFILPAERADTDVRMRIFTPAVEMRWPDIPPLAVRLRSRTPE